MLSLETTIGGIQFASCVWNSSNPSATTKDDLQAFADSKSGAIVTRTTCPGFQHDDALHQWRSWGNCNSINCFGYSPNDLDFYIRTIQDISPKKPVFFSLSGSAQQVHDMIQKLDQAEFSTPVLVEINLSCPNIPGKPPIAYDFDGMRQYLQVALPTACQIPVGVKTTPYFYDLQFQDCSKVLNDFKLSFVTCINTIGSGLVVDVATESAVLPGTYGGLGGPAVHATALANVRQLRQYLKTDIAVIGVGGVDSGETAMAMILCGASAVEVGSAVLHRGVAGLDTIQAQLLDLIKRKNYSGVADFQGKLKVQQ